MADVEKSNTDAKSINNDPIVLYKFRWYILLTECLLNLTNSIIFSSYAAVANFTDDYYGQSTTDYLSMIFLGISVPSTLVAICLAQKAGLRLLIISSAFLNGAGAGIRLLSNVGGLNQESRLALIMIGQAFGAFANPGTLFLNTKIAATWFPASQRAKATTLLSIATPLGMLIASPMAAAIVKVPTDLLWLNCASFIPSATVFFMALLIRHSSPPTPPSRSSNLEPLDTFAGIKVTLTNKNYMILTMCLGITLGLFNTLYTMIAQILCTRGYTNSFAALCVALLISGGLLGSTLAAFVVDRTKLFDEVLKISLAIASLASIVFMEAALVPNMHVVLAIALTVYGAFGLAYYAIAMETSAEITYPVAETTSAGFIGLCGQLFGTIFIAIWNNLAQPLSDRYANVQKCTLSGQTADVTSQFARDMTVPIFTFHILGVLAAITLIMFFKPKYPRVTKEIASEDASKKPNEKNLVVKPYAVEKH